MVANAAADAGERVILLDDAQRILVAPLSDQGYVALRALPGGASIPTGGDSQLFKGKSAWNRLGVQLESSAARGEASVKVVGQDNRADVSAIATTDAFLQVNIARVVADANKEIAGRASNIDDLGAVHQLDIEMPADTHQLGTDDAHGTIVSWEGLVQLRHVAANRRLGLHQIDPIAGLSQVQ